MRTLEDSGSARTAAAPRRRKADWEEIFTVSEVELVVRSEGAWSGRWEAEALLRAVQSRLRRADRVAVDCEGEGYACRVLLSGAAGAGAQVVEERLIAALSASRWIVLTQRSRRLGFRLH
ncbi:MAG: hypothetical protein HYV63_22345 [Candidatus Schekmanbacteria bacterium]|nr:hypothetical protein [Candidatus Schekmanbacteria bacterium]